jgi:hypothetical protein
MMIDKKLSIVFVWKTRFSAFVLDILDANNHHGAALEFMSNDSKLYMGDQNENFEGISQLSDLFSLQNSSIMAHRRKEHSSTLKGKFFNNRSSCNPFISCNKTFEKSHLMTIEICMKR